jgi:hypothetical protein
VARDNKVMLPPCPEPGGFLWVLVSWDSPQETGCLPSHRANIRVDVLVAAVCMQRSEGFGSRVVFWFFILMLFSFLKFIFARLLLNIPLLV